MDCDAYTVRPFRDADYEAEARLDFEVDPEHTFTAQEMRRWTETAAAVPGRVQVRFGVDHRESGTTVGIGSLHNLGTSFHPQKFWIHVGVARAHRRRGVGAELYSILEREALARSVLSLWGGGRDDDDESSRFWTRRGFVPLRKTWLSRLDVASANLAAFPDRSKRLAERGIQVTTLAAEGASRPEVRQRLYRLATIAAADVPRVGEYTPYTFEEFLEFDVDGPGAMHDGMFLACQGEEFVGMSSLEHVESRSDTLRVGFTGTHPGFRGLGIASELKRRAVEFARARGYRYLVTANDSLNRPIWAINAKLGFRQEVTWIWAEKKFAPESR